MATNKVVTQDDRFSYYFNVPQIDRDLQLCLLQLAIKDLDEYSEGDMTHKEQHAIYGGLPKKGMKVISCTKSAKDEFNGARCVAGYCKDRLCKSNRLWSYPGGSKIMYNCIDCLAKHVYENRNECIGLPIKVVVEDEQKNNGEKAHPQKLLVDFTVDGVKIKHDLYGTLIKTKAEEDFYLSYRYEPDEDMPTLYLMPGPPGYENHWLKPGRYDAKIRGRKACKNILLGLECKSMNKEEYEDIKSKSRSIIMNSLPPGVPGFVEKNGKDNVGQIITQEYCPACAYTNNTPDSPRKYKHEDKDISNLYTDLENLRSTVAELRLELMQKSMYIKKLEAQITEFNIDIPLVTNLEYDDDDYLSE